MEGLPPEMLGEILAGLAEYAPALRQVCHRWLLAVRAFPARKTRKYGLSFLARNGRKGLIVWVREQRVGRDFMQPQIDVMYAGACYGGHLDLVCLLHDWGVNDPGPAFVKAARRGRAVLASQLLLWGGVSSRSIVRGVNEAARAGHCKLVKLFSEMFGGSRWDANGMKDVLQNAARGGHLDLMEWAQSNGADNYNRAFCKAARGGHTEAMKILRRWGQNVSLDLNGAVPKAIRGGHIDALQLLWSWGAQNVGSLGDAAIGGHQEVAGLLLRRGVQDVDKMLDGAAYRGSEDLCRSARDWGATAYSPAFRTAALRGHTHLLPILYDRTLEQTRADSVLAPSADRYESFNEPLLCDAFQGALCAGHLETAEWLRSQGASALHDDYGHAFTFAAEAGNVAMLRATYIWANKDGAWDEEMGGRVDDAFCAAAANGEEEAMKLLKTWGASNLAGALVAAVENNQVRVMRLLNLWGVNGIPGAPEDALSAALELGCREAELLLRSWGTGLGEV